MRPECKVGVYPDDILAVFVVLVSESLQYFDLNLALLMQLLPVFEDLYSDMLLDLMIKAPQDDTKGTSTKLLLHLIPV
jgi:hypothetical protein